MARSELTPEELHLWRAWQKVSALVNAQVARDVSEASGLSAAEYGILERLAQHRTGCLRQRELAVALEWDKSRISHQLTRMHERGLLTRAKTPEAGSQIVITRSGRTALARARPIHARAVRRHLLEQLSSNGAATILNLADVTGRGQRGAPGA